MLISMLGLSAGLLATGLFYFGLKYVDAGVMSFLEKLQAVFVIILASVFLGEHFSMKRVPLMFLTLLLALILSVQDAKRIQWSNLNMLDVLAGIGCSVFYGANVVMYKQIGKHKISSNEIVFLDRFLAPYLFVFSFSLPRAE